MQTGHRHRGSGCLLALRLALLCCCAAAAVVLLKGGHVTHSIPSPSQPNTTASPAAAQPKSSDTIAQFQQDLADARLQIETLTVDLGNAARHLEQSLLLRAAASHAAALQTEVQIAKPAAAKAAVVEEGCQPPPASVAGVVAAVVTVTFSRADYLRQHLDSLLAVHGRDPGNWRAFPLHIAQDGNDSAVAALAGSLRPYGIRHLQFLDNEEQRAKITDATLPKERRYMHRHRTIAAHYRFIFHQMFDCFGFPKVIILEDDMQLAVDFFPYFGRTAQLLDEDPTLYCVSSWNDNGQYWNVRDSTALRRTDFFPGLGWMLSAEVWQSIRPGFMAGNYWTWDDYLRIANNRRGRQCIQPEVCRNFNFGAQGSSMGQFYREHLQPVRLNRQDVNWTAQDLSYLQPDAYNSLIRQKLAGAAAVASVADAMAAAGDARLEYHSQAAFANLTTELHWFGDWREGTPRGAYAGVLSAPWTGGPRRPGHGSSGGSGGSNDGSNGSSSDGSVQRRSSEPNSAGGETGDSRGGRGSATRVYEHDATAAWDSEGSSVLSAPQDRRTSAQDLAAGHTIYLVPGAEFVQSTKDYHAQRYVAAGREALGLSTVEGT